MSLVLLMGAGWIAAPQTTGSDSVVYVLRHAERADAAEPEPDPHLSVAGTARAAQLADLLAADPITAVLSSDYHRTRETSEPLAARLGLEVEIYDPRALSELAADLGRRAGRTVVVGHSNTTPQLVELLGGDPGEPIDDATEFDRLYVVIRGADGGVTTLHLRYGEPST